MITRDQIPQVVGRPVHDSEGKKIGDAKHMYLDDRTGEPEWVTVKTGFFGNNETFVPTRAARLAQDHLEVPYDKETVKGAPNVDVDSGGHLSVEEERHLYGYYGLNTDGTAAQDRTDGASGRRGAEAGAAGAGAAGAAGAAGVAGRDTSRGDRAAAAEKTGQSRQARPRPTSAGTGSEAGVGAGTGAGYAAGRSGPAERLAPDTRRDATGTDDEAMTRSEEELLVNVERRASGRARLHKYVDVEEVEQTVPIRHEEVRLERLPITEESRDAALAGPEISEAEHEVILHEEQAVVDTRVVPKERVRMRVEEHIEQKTVRGRVRKERIETDLTGPDADPSGPGADQGRDDPRFR